MTTKYPVGGERQPVYDLMHRLGFKMAKWTDKHWSRPGCEVRIFGAGSMASVHIGKIRSFECPLDELETELFKTS